MSARASSVVALTVAGSATASPRAASARAVPSPSSARPSRRVDAAFRRRGSARGRGRPPRRRPGTSRPPGSRTRASRGRPAPRGRTRSARAGGSGRAVRRGARSRPAREARRETPPARARRFTSGAAILAPVARGGRELLEGGGEAALRADAVCGAVHGRNDLPVAERERAHFRACGREPLHVGVAQAGERGAKPRVVGVEEVAAHGRGRLTRADSAGRELVERDGRVRRGAREARRRPELPDEEPAPCPGDVAVRRGARRLEERRAENRRPDGGCAPRRARARRPARRRARRRPGPARRCGAPAGDLRGRPGRRSRRTRGAPRPPPGRRGSAPSLRVGERELGVPRELPGCAGSAAVAEAASQRPS